MLFKQKARSIMLLSHRIKLLISQGMLFINMLFCYFRFCRHPSPSPVQTDEFTLPVPVIDKGILITFLIIKWLLKETIVF